MNIEKFKTFFGVLLALGFLPLGCITIYCVKNLLKKKKNLLK